MAKKPEEDKDQGKFSFDHDPGRLQDSSSDLDFTFSDIPVLGQDPKLKEKFSFEPTVESAAASRGAEEAALASFEQMLREIPAVTPGDEETGQVEPAEIAPDRSHGIDQGFLAEQRQRWQHKVQQATSQRRRAITIKLVYALIPIFVIAGLIYLGGSLWFHYQAEEEAKRNYVMTRKRPLIDRHEADEARKLKEAMEAELAKAEQAAAIGEHAEALRLYRQLAERQFFKPEFLMPRLARSLHKMGQDQEAITVYREALAAGVPEASVVIEFAALLNQQSLFAEAITMLTEASQARPDESALTAMLAETYFGTGDQAQAMAAFRALKRASMTERQLDIYGGLLRAAGDREEARKVFFFAAKRYNSLPAYLAAVEAANKTDERIEIMAHASGALADAREVATALALLVKYLGEANKLESAKTQALQVDAARVMPEHVPEFFDTCRQLGFTEAEIEAVFKRIVVGYPENLNLHLDIQRRLEQAKLDNLALRLYGEWWAASSGNTISNYLYGRALRSGPEAIARFLRATQLKPDFLLAWRALADNYFDSKQWAEAESAYSQCARLDPDNQDIRHRLALVKLYSGHGDMAVVDEYERHLRQVGALDSASTRLLLDLARRLPTPERANSYLERLRLLPGMTPVEIRVEELRNQLFFGTLNDRDFEDITPRAARDIQQLHLISRGKFREVLLMPTATEDFPEFWKVFLCRITNIEWQDNAERLVEKHRGDSDPTIPIIASMWLGKLSVEEARAMNPRIPRDQESLFYFMLAEEYRRQKNEIGAKICYTRALKTEPNPLRRVIDFFNRPRRGF